MEPTVRTYSVHVYKLITCLLSINRIYYVNGPNRIYYVNGLIAYIMLIVRRTIMELFIIITGL